MPTTPGYGLPYPAITDPPNGAAQIQALAENAETALDGKAAAADLNAAQQQLDAPIVGVRLTLSATSQSIAAATDTVMWTDTNVYGPVGVSVANDIVTVNEAGLYQISSGFRTYDGGQKNAFITDGAANSSLDGCYVCGASDAPDVFCSTMIPLQAGDTVKAWVWSSGGFTLGYTDGRPVFFTVFKVGNL